jgi:hypothetical protein
LDGTVETLGGWRLLRHCALPGPLPCALAVVALHPCHGLALVDPLPHLTPDAILRLQERLRDARFGAVYGEAWPPALHLALYAAEFARLPEVLAEAFQGRPAPEIPGGDAWMDTVARALLPGLPLASAPSPSAGRIRRKARTVRRRAGLRWRRDVPLALVLLGIVLAWVTWPRPEATLAAAPPVPPRASAMVPRAATPPELAAPVPPPGEAAPEPAMPTEASLLGPPVEPVPGLASPDAVAALEPPGEATPNPAFREGLPLRAVLAPAAVPVVVPVVARTDLRCQALVQRIQTGEEASEDELLRLQACRLGG